MSAREDHMVELVSASGRATGQATVDDAHQAPGQLHRAFSVVLLDEGGRMLMQQRAAGKTRFPSRWANACCGHPAPGEDPAVSAGRRLGEELGPVFVLLHEVGVYTYRAEDPATGRVEHEYDHVFVGHVEAMHPLEPNPDEVAALRWMDADELAADLAERPDSYAPWLAGVADLLRAARGR